MRLPTNRLGQPPPLGRVQLQKLQTFGYHHVPVLRQLRVSSQHVPTHNQSRIQNPSRGVLRHTAARGPSGSLVGAPQSSRGYGGFSQSSRRPAPTLLLSAKVWLLRRNIRTIRPSSKLDVRRLGPFIVIGPVGTSSFRLDLPPAMHIHPVFHVSLLEPHVANKFPGRIQLTPHPIQVDGFPEFEVRAILDSKIRRRKLLYFVDWVGYV